MVRVVEVGGCEIPLDSQTAGSAVHSAVVVLRSETGSELGTVDNWDHLHEIGPEEHSSDVVWRMVWANQGSTSNQEKWASDQETWQQWTSGKMKSLTVPEKMHSHIMQCSDQALRPSVVRSQPCKRLK